MVGSLNISQNAWLVPLQAFQAAVYDYVNEPLQVYDVDNFSANQLSRTIIKKISLVDDSSKFADGILKFDAWPKNFINAENFTSEAVYSPGRAIKNKSPSSLTECCSFQFVSLRAPSAHGISRVAENTLWCCSLVRLLYKSFFRAAYGWSKRNMLCYLLQSTFSQLTCLIRKVRSITCPHRAA
jgi:hypothetical protein